MEVQEIIAPIDRLILKSELTPALLVGKTNNANNEIYILNHKTAPQTLREIGRLRELTFRAAGGGTGKELDLDDYDTNPVPYQQLIVWNPQDEQIVGGYRFLRCADVTDADGTIHMSTVKLFHFSDKFKKDYLPYTIELGRSFVQPEYQGHSRKGLYSLDNLWDGLGALIVNNPDIRYFFGKVTMYRHYNAKARDLVLYFMNHYFNDVETLARPFQPLPYHFDTHNYKELFDNLPYKEGHKVLNTHVRALGENIPPLINAYMNLSSTMKTFGTVNNPYFGDVEETGILVTIADIYDAKKERHLKPFLHN